jgi:hypothetical protein
MLGLLVILISKTLRVLDQFTPFSPNHQKNICSLSYDHSHNASILQEMMILQYMMTGFLEPI